MKSDHGPISSLLDGFKKYVVPIYQRNYAWEESECRQLLSDVIAAGRSENPDASHFIGSIVYIGETSAEAMGANRFLVIDGQQRLTTASLLVLAMVHDEKELTDIGVDPRDLSGTFIANERRDDSSPDYLKLQLNEDDQRTYRKLIHQLPLDESDQNRVAANYRFFRDTVTSGNVADVVKGLARIQVVSIRLDRGLDNPQAIFESMNSTGKRLSQSDLVRNYLLMDLPPDAQTDLFRRFWHPLVQRFGAIPDAQLDAFLRTYLTVKLERVPKIGELYPEFKKYVRDHRSGVLSDVVGRRDLMEELARLGDFYTRVALGRETDVELRAAFADIAAWKADVAHPLLLQLYSFFDSSVISREQFLDLARLVESYIVRRAICAVPTNSLQRTFARLLVDVPVDESLPLAVHARLLSFDGYTRMPDDEEVMRGLGAVDLYGSTRAHHVLRRLENSYHPKEQIALGAYTIEHVMPQDLNIAWRAELGSEAERVHSTYLHLLANLTLTGYNPELSSRPFAYKKELNPGGFAHSPLQLNHWIAERDSWTEIELIERGLRLAARFCEVWPMPRKSEPVGIAVATDSSGSRMESSVAGPEAYEQLSGSVRDAYAALEHGALELDELVTVEYLSSDIVFAVYAPFAAVEPMAQCFLLVLHGIDADDLRDPLGLTRSTVNGNPSVIVREVGDVPYAVELLKQAAAVQIAASE